MGASVGTGDGDSVNVELNVVPFIDLMSCLTAFLLVTAVWSVYAQVRIEPKGLGKDSIIEGNEEPPITLSLLLTHNEIFVGLSSGERQQIRSANGQYDWTALEGILADYREIPGLQSSLNRDVIEIAAEDEVAYQDIVTAMDYSIDASFTRVGFVDPMSLSVRFVE